MFKGDFCALRFAADGLTSCLGRSADFHTSGLQLLLFSARRAAVHEPIVDLQPASLQLTEPQYPPDQQVCRDQTERAKQCV